MTQEPRIDPASLVQVASAEIHYNPMTYLTPARMASVGYQFRLLHEHFPGARVLEIGAAARLPALLLGWLGHQVKSLDVDARLGPDIVGSVTDMPCEDGAFDAILCCQVLEHLPFEQSVRALREMRRVARLGCVISVPCNDPLALIRIWNYRRSGIRRLRFPQLRRRRRRNLEEHHWELGCEVRTREFRAAIGDCGFRIAAEERPYENLYHHFFVLVPAS